MAWCADVMSDFTCLKSTLWVSFSSRKASRWLINGYDCMDSELPGFCCTSQASHGASALGNDEWNATERKPEKIPLQFLHYFLLWQTVPAGGWEKEWDIETSLHSETGSGDTHAPPDHSSSFSLFLTHVVMPFFISNGCYLTITIDTVGLLEVNHCSQFICLLRYTRQWRLHQSRSVKSPSISVWILKNNHIIWFF